jgi:predicted nucleotidyltransferase
LLFLGGAGRHSDVDLVIISDDFESKDTFERVDMMAGVELTLLPKFKKPFDLLLKTKDEYAILRQKLLLKSEII